MATIVQKRAEKTMKVDVDKIVAAVLGVIKDDKHVFTAAKENEVPKTSLYRYVAKVKSQIPNYNEVTKEELTEFIGSTVGWKTNAVCILCLF